MLIATSEIVNVKVFECAESEVDVSVTCLNLNSDLTQKALKRVQPQHVVGASF